MKKILFAKFGITNFPSKKLSVNETKYTDEVTLYAGRLTGILSHFLIYFYKKRHKKPGPIINSTKKASH